MVSSSMKGVLNTTTGTVHKHELGASGLHTHCGVSYTLPPVQLREVRVEQVTGDHSVSKCGSCFEDAGGY